MRIYFWFCTVGVSLMLLIYTYILYRLFSPQRYDYVKRETGLGPGNILRTDPTLVNLVSHTELKWQRPGFQTGFQDNRSAISCIGKVGIYSLQKKSGPLSHNPDIHHTPPPPAIVFGAVYCICIVV
jgi:hypothetical protein